MATTHKINKMAAIALLGGAFIADLLQILFKVLWLSIFLGVVAEGLSMLVSAIVITFYALYFFVLKHLGLLKPRYFILFVVAVLLASPPIVNVAFGLTFWTWRTLVRAEKDAKKHSILEEKKKKERERNAKIMRGRLRQQRNAEALYIAERGRAQEAEQILLWQRAAEKRRTQEYVQSPRDYSQPPPPATAYTATNDNVPHNKARMPFEGDRPQKQAA